MITSQPYRMRGLLYACLFILLLILIDIGLLVLLIGPPIGLAHVVIGCFLLSSLAVLISWGHWIWALFNSRYEVRQGLLRLRWGGAHWHVPVDGIAGWQIGDHGAEVSDFRGVRWPGYYVGEGWLRWEATGQEQSIVFLATVPRAEQLWLVTPERVYAISPVDRDLFRMSLMALQGTVLSEVGVALPESEVTTLDWGFGLGAVVIFGLGGVSNLLLYVNAAVRYGVVAEGRVLFGLATGAFVCWVANWLIGFGLYQREEQKSLAFIMWSMTLVVQLLAWGAIWFL
ncbi:MAG TPA: PH domain-containing protein [Anaerolineae bacterium]|nr:PH domain-containing protein [Anaerolineae bacterium]